MAFIKDLLDNAEDGLWNLVKHLEFLQYDHSIEQIKPSRFDFPTGTKFSEADRKTNLPGIKKVKAMLFRVPEQVFLNYSAGGKSVKEIIAVTAIRAPVEDWKLLERMVVSFSLHRFNLLVYFLISSFYRLTFDKPTIDVHGDKDLWQNYSTDRLEPGWKQLLFVCCGPQGLAYLVKRMLKRNWAIIVRNSLTMSEVNSNRSHTFSNGSILKLFLEYAKLNYKTDALMQCLEKVNALKPLLGPEEVIDKVKASLDEHMKTVKRYRCTICSYASRTKRCLDDHLNSHSGVSPYLCEICGNAYKQRSTLKQHIIRKHTGNFPYYCDICAMPFIIAAHLKYHINIHEKKGTTYPHCYKCLAVFKNQIDLAEHLKTHADDPAFECKVCHKKLDSETALLAHSRNHDKVKPFHCHICERGFLSRHHLVEHYNVHSESRVLFSCSTCNKEFKNIRSKRIHEVSQHGEQL